MDKRTVALGIAALGAVAAAVLVTVVKGGHGSPKRNAVASYINTVDGVQQQMRLPLTRVLAAYHDFTRSSASTRKSAQELAAATRTLARLRVRIASVEAPPEAKRLHRLMLQLVHQEAVVTTEVQQLAVFTPRYRAALAAYQAAGAGLARALAKVKTPKPHQLWGTRAQILKAQRAYSAAAVAAAAAQADAVDAYDAALIPVLRAFRRLHPPKALAPADAAQIRALEATRTTGARLSAGLRSTNRAGVPALGRAFTLASRVSQSVAAQRAEIRAIKAYNARARAITAAAGRVQAEVARLQRTLP
jgi:hypothetical protein